MKSESDKDFGIGRKMICLGSIATVYSRLLRNSRLSILTLRRSTPKVLDVRELSTESIS